MKLYTEQEVRNILNRIVCDNEAIDEYIDRMTPIELPSDEEIEKFAQIASSIREEKTQGEWIAYKSVIAGAKWVIEQIKQ